MQGFKITATYTPDNTVQTPDPDGGDWGDATQAWNAAVFVNYNMGELLNLGPMGPTTSKFIDYVNTSDSAGAAIRAVVIWDIGLQDPFDIEAFLAVFELAAASQLALNALAAFDSGSFDPMSAPSVTYESVFVEQYSDVETP